MPDSELTNLTARIKLIQTDQRIGRVAEIGRGTLGVTGLSDVAGLGDQVSIMTSEGQEIGGEVLRLSKHIVLIMPDENVEGISIGARVILRGKIRLAPHNSWIGRVVNPLGQPLDGGRLAQGGMPCSLWQSPPAAAKRRPLGERLETGLAAFNTLLPLVRGQRIGLFSGSGVGKSSLLAQFARGVQADVVVVALVGERGREVREFVDNVLGPRGMARSVVVAATSDQSPLVRRRCAWSAMTIAEYFRDQGKNVLLLMDSITRFAEAHREVALGTGEDASLRGYPPSMAHQIMALCERAGPGTSESGDITAVFSVLVAGSDMEEPVADVLRGALDGHVVLDRRIAERGRFPAVDLLRSVSRSLPAAASAVENNLIAHARRLLGAYDQAEMMIQAGLYARGSDPLVDAAIDVWPALDTFLSEAEEGTTGDSFTRLAAALSHADDVGVPTLEAIVAPKEQNAPPIQAPKESGAGLQQEKGSLH